MGLYSLHTPTKCAQEKIFSHTHEMQSKQHSHTYVMETRIYVMEHTSLNQQKQNKNFHLHHNQNNTKSPQSFHFSLQFSSFQLLPATSSNYSPYLDVLMPHLWHQGTPRWVDPGWILGAHQSSLSLPSPVEQGREIEEKALRSTKDRERSLTSYHHR